MTEKKDLNTYYSTPVIRLSFPHLFELDMYDNYSVSCPIPMSDAKALKEIKECCLNAIERKFGESFKSEFGGKIADPVKLGNEKRPDDEVYKDTIVLDANMDPENTKPKGKMPGVIRMSDWAPITGYEDIKAGDYVRVSVNFYCAEPKGKKMVCIGLRNVMLVERGEALTQDSSPDHDFAEFRPGGAQALKDTGVKPEAEDEDVYF